MVHPVVPAVGVDALLDELVATLTAVDGAIVLSPDGLLLAASRDVDAAFADYLSAASAGLHALAAAAGRQAGACQVRQAVVEMEYALLVVTPVGPVAILAVMLDGAPDFTSVGGQISEFAERVGRRLGLPAPAPGLRSAS
jgi:predicted regulator of Ras-like GTPase activity (Roadblock/LC7/MglB family)